MKNFLIFTMLVFLVGCATEQLYFKVKGECVYNPTTGESICPKN